MSEAGSEGRSVGATDDVCVLCTCNAEACAILNGHVQRIYIVVQSEEGSNTVELPCDSTGLLPLSTLHIEFPLASGLKYKNPATGLFRVLPSENGKLTPPDGGWGSATYVICAPPPQQPVKRTESYEAEPPTKFQAVQQQSGAYTFSQFGAGRGQRFPAPARGAARGRGSQGSTGFTQRAAAPAKAGPIPSHAAYAFCEVCQTSLNSAGQAQAHYTGKKHLEAVGGGNSGGGTGYSARGRGRGRSRGGIYNQNPNAAYQNYDFCDDSSALRF